MQDLSADDLWPLDDLVYDAVATRTNRTSAGLGPLLKARVTHLVARAGRQEVLMVLCAGSASARRAQLEEGPEQGDSSLGSVLSVSGHVSFSNPYGYIPALLMGNWPTAGALTVAYSLIILIYGAVSLRAWHYGHLLQLHVLLWGLGLAGLMEAATRFGMLNQRNLSGAPPCCPATSDMLASEVLGVGKRAAFRGVFLALALGYGVVRTSLPRLTWIGSGVALVIYATFSLLAQVYQLSVIDAARSLLLDFCQLAADICILAFIYVAFASTMQGLHEAGEEAKKSMYEQLLRVMRAFGMAWVALSLLVLLFSASPSTLPWRFIFLVDAFWEIMYVGLLLAVCWIWLPGEATA